MPFSQVFVESPADVVGSLVLHYIENWERVLREFRRVLRPDGVVVFSAHHPIMDWELTPDDCFAVRQVTDYWTMGDSIRYST